MNRSRQIFEWGVLILFAIVSVSGLSIAQQLIWSDEFDGTTLDYNKWDIPQYNRRSNDNGPDGYGQKLTTLVNEFQAAGHYSVAWDAKEVPSCIYLVHFQANDHIGTEKIILQK